MAAPILKTKLYIPRPRPELVPRPRLIERLSAGLHRKLTLLSAPAGFGKTTLLSEWLAGGEQLEPEVRVAWLSLDEGDNDVGRFLAYFVAALQTVEDAVGQGALVALQSPGAVNVEAALTALLNEVADLPGDFVLILDDYHAIESQAVDQSLTFALDHLPPQLHLVVATRVDPPLPLARLRGRGQLSELRTADLRFTQDEVAAFLNQVMGLRLAAEDIAALEARTEGWIVGLQLAALSMQEREDVTGFIRSFTGSHHHVLDYLVQEVLHQQSPDIQSFLLQTSVLERLSGPLCDAICSTGANGTGPGEGQATLERLAQSNLFIVPLDDERRWYRYHHLFAELLRHRLTRTTPERIEGLHERASHWLEDNGFTDQAIRHALAMQDKHLAADLIERHAKAMLFQGHARTRLLLDWFELLPKDLLRARPLLSVYHAWTFALDNPFANHDAIEESLARAERSLDPVTPDGRLEKAVSGHAAGIRGLLSQPPVQTDHDPHAVLALFQEARRLIPASEAEIHCSISIGMGYEFMHLEDTQAAIEANRAAFATARAVNNHLVAPIALRNEALIAYHLGELDRAVGVCQDGMALFDRSPAGERPFSPGLGILSIALGYLLVEGDELEKAAVELAQGVDWLEWSGEYESIILGLMALVRLHLVRGEHETALQAIERFERRWSASAVLTDTLRRQVELSRLSEHSGVPATIAAWVEKHRPPLEAEFGFQGISPWAETRHLAHLTWIRAQIARVRLESGTPQGPVLQPCLDYLDRRLQGAEQHGLSFRSIECSVLKALVLDVLGQDKGAMAVLSQALSLAEPSRFRRVFLDKGLPMARLLREAGRRGVVSTYARDLLAAWDAWRHADQPAPPARTAERGRASRAASTLSFSLIEPLTDRELEVLHLMAEGLTYNEIADRILVSLNTVRTHVKNVYGKLLVHKRSQAIARARELGLL